MIQESRLNPMTDPQDDLSIGDHEIAVRRVSHRDQTFDTELGRRRPTTQAFLQNGRDGLTSVFLLSHTTPTEVAEEVRNKHERRNLPTKDTRCTDVILRGNRT